MTGNGARGRRKRGPSIGDVARLAGVSAQTVSRVSTGADPVRPETRAKVEQAMEQLGYSPNRAARALREGRYGTIGLLAHRFDRTGEALMTDAILRAAEAEDYSVTLLSVAAASSDGWEPAARRLHNQTVDGVIVIRSEGDSAQPLALSARMPVAVSDARAHGLYPCVVSDEFASIQLAVRHLLDLGHRTVHLLSGPEGSEPARLRAAGWRAALTRAGIEAPAPVAGDWTAESGFRAGRVFAHDPDVTAVLCANDEMALGLISGLHAAGVAVPTDVSIVGFDGIALGEFSVPPLTTVRQDFGRMGTELVRLVLEQIRSPQMRTIPDVTVASELIVRGSTAPPRR